MSDGAFACRNAPYKICDRTAVTDRDQLERLLEVVSDRFLFGVGSDRFWLFWVYGDK